MTHKWEELTKHFTPEDRASIEAEKEKLRKQITADEIASLADSGQNISEHFTNDGEMKPPFKEVVVMSENLTVEDIISSGNKWNSSTEGVLNCSFSVTKGDEQKMYEMRIIFLADRYGAKTTCNYKTVSEREHFATLEEAVMGAYQQVVAHYNNGSSYASLHEKEIAIANTVGR